MPLLVVLFFARGAVALALFAALFLALLPVGVGVVLLPVAVRADRCRCGRGPSAKSKAAGRSAARVVPPGAGPAVRQVVPISARGASPGAGPGAGSPEGLPVSGWCRPGDPPAGAGLRSGGRAPGGPGRRGRCARPGGSFLCRWPCSLVRLAALLLALLPAVVGVLLLLVAARADRAAGLPAVVVALVVLVVGKEQGGRVIRGPGGSTWRRACCPPGRADLGPGCSTWFRIAGGVAG